MSADDTMRLGFIGTGTITAAIVTGLRKAGAPFDVVVSPRNDQVAADLSARFERVRVAASNQDVLDACDVAFLAVRPQVADEVLQALRFRPDHHVVSLVATYSQARIARIVAPAATVACAVPQPTVGGQSGPTVVFPRDPLAATIFGRIGPVFEVDSEADFRAFFTATAAMAAYFTLLATIASWLERHGLGTEAAQRYVATMFRGLGEVPLQSGRSFDELAKEFKTAGGLNEQFAAELAARGAFDACSAGLDAIHARIVAGATAAR